jgi:CDP-diacylglycerol---serine O-phosphatidyltransferase
MFRLPNLLTAGNLLCGIVAIVFTLQGRLDLAVYLLLLGMFFDFLDGFVARLLQQQGELGKQLDSLADMVSFGVAPGIIAFVLFIISGAVQLTGSLTESLYLPTMGESVKNLIELYFKHLLYGHEPSDLILFHGWTLVLPFVSLFIPFFSLFRLAKFNLDTRQSEQFIGLPTPANTLFILGITLTLWFGFQSESIGAVLAEILLREQILMTLLVVFSFLLTAEIPLIALKFKSFSPKKNWEKFALLVGSLILIIALKQFALSFIVLLYLILSTIHYFIQKSN